MKFFSKAHLICNWLSVLSTWWCSLSIVIISFNASPCDKPNLITLKKVIYLFFLCMTLLLFISNTNRNIWRIMIWFDFRSRFGYFFNYKMCRIRFVLLWQYWYLTDFICKYLSKNYHFFQWHKSCKYQFTDFENFTTQKIVLKYKFTYLS